MARTSNTPANSVAGRSSNKSTAVHTSNTPTAIRTGNPSTAVHTANPSSAKHTGNSTSAAHTGGSNLAVRTGKSSPAASFLTYDTPTVITIAEVAAAAARAGVDIKDLFTWQQLEMFPEEVRAAILSGRYPRQP